MGVVLDKLLDCMGGELLAAFQSQTVYCILFLHFASQLIGVVLLILVQSLIRRLVVINSILLLPKGRHRSIILALLSTLHILIPKLLPLLLDLGQSLLFFRLMLLTLLQYLKALHHHLLLPLLPTVFILLHIVLVQLHDFLLLHTLNGLPPHLLLMVLFSTFFDFGFGHLDPALFLLSKLVIGGDLGLYEVGCVLVALLDDQ